MDYGLLLTTAKPGSWTEREVVEATLGYAELAEETGYTSGWLLEHHFTPYGLCPDTLSLAGFLLGRTRTLRIGTAVVIAPLAHPIRLAESAAMLDQCSDGRFDLGVGRGGFPSDFQVFDVDPRETHELTQQCVDLVLRAWTEERVGSTEGHFRFDPVPVYPKPFTRPRPHLYVAGESPSTVEWAATNALPLITQVGLQDEEARSKHELYDEFAEAAGHDPADIPHAVVAVGYVADSREEARKAIFDTIEWWGEEGNQAGFQLEDLRNLPNYRFHLRRIEQAALEGRGSAGSWISDWLDNSPVGPPEYCVERLEAIAASSGASQIILAVEGAGSRELTEENIRRFATDVIPKVSA